MAEEKKVNRVVHYPGCVPELTQEEMVTVKNRSRLIVLSVILAWFTLTIGTATIITLGHKLFAIRPVLY